PPPTPSPLPTLSLHDALPIFSLHGIQPPDQVQHLPTRVGEVRLCLEELPSHVGPAMRQAERWAGPAQRLVSPVTIRQHDALITRSEEHTSELQSRFDLVCRLL